MIANNVPEIITLRQIFNWLKSQLIKRKLGSANRDADVLRAQIKNDSQALAFIQRKQAILSSELLSISK